MRTGACFQKYQKRYFITLFRCTFGKKCFFSHKEKKSESDSKRGRDDEEKEERYRDKRRRHSGDGVRMKPLRSFSREGRRVKQEERRSSRSPEIGSLERWRNRRESDLAFQGFHYGPQTSAGQSQNQEQIWEGNKEDIGIYEEQEKEEGQERFTTNFFSSLFSIFYFYSILRRRESIDERLLRMQREEEEKEVRKPFFAKVLH